MNPTKATPSQEKFKKEKKKKKGKKKAEGEKKKFRQENLPVILLKNQEYNIFTDPL